MKRLFCRLLGHHWNEGAAACGWYDCERCGHFTDMDWDVPLGLLPGNGNLKLEI